MIDEKKLIEDIKDRLFINNALEQIFIEIVEQQPKTDWIPCEERLPDKEGDYLTCDKKGNIHIFHHHPSFEFPFTISKRDPRYYQPIAWQPLPQPYREDKQ